MSDPDKPHAESVHVMESWQCGCGSSCTCLCECPDETFLETLAVWIGRHHDAPAGT